MLNPHSRQMLLPSHQLLRSDLNPDTRGGAGIRLVRRTRRRRLRRHQNGCIFVSHRLLYGVLQKLSEAGQILLFATVRGIGAGSRWTSNDRQATRSRRRGTVRIGFASFGSFVQAKMLLD